jgi:hypothetical protein
LNQYLFQFGRNSDSNCFVFCHDRSAFYGTPLTFTNPPLDKRVESWLSLFINDNHGRAIAFPLEYFGAARESTSEVPNRTVTLYG